MITWHELRTSLLKTTRFILLLSIVTNLAMLSLPLYSLQIFDRVLMSSSLETLWMLLTGVSILAITAICFEHLRRSTLNQFSLYLDERLFPDLIKRMNAEDLDKNKKNFLEQYNFVQKNIQSSSVLIFVDALLIPLFIFITYLIHPLLGLFTLSINILLLVMVLVKYKWQLPSQSTVQSKCIENQELMLSNPSALAWLTMTANHDSWYEDKKQGWQAQVDTSKQNNFPEVVVTNLNQCIRWLAQAGLPTMGALLLLSNDITIGGFIAALIIGGKTFMPVEAMISNLDGFRKMKLFFQKVKLILEKEKNENIAYASKVKGFISINELDLNEDSENINNKPRSQFNLSTNAGEMVAIVGPANAGQNTIVQKLMGYSQDNSGSITIDGVRLKDWDAQYLYRCIGFVSGSIQLPEATIKSIITAFGQTSVSQATLAAERTGLNQKLIELNLSYDEIYSFDSFSQSSNMTLKQLIAITAAIAHEPKILIFDNPETNLDMESLEILKTIITEEKKSGKTIILTTQSKSLLNIASRMILLNKGNVLFSGKPDEFYIKKQGVAANSEFNYGTSASILSKPFLEQHVGART